MVAGHCLSGSVHSAPSPAAHRCACGGPPFIGRSGWLRVILQFMFNFAGNSSHLSLFAARAIRVRMTAMSARRPVESVAVSPESGYVSSRSSVPPRRGPGRAHPSAGSPPPAPGSPSGSAATVGARRRKFKHNVPSYRGQPPHYPFTDSSLHCPGGGTAKRNAPRTV